MAAGVGHFFTHFILSSAAIVELGVWQTLVRVQTYAFYCVLLSAGIIISQLRSRRRDPAAGWLRGQFLPSLGVAAFFCVLSIFDGPQGHAALKHHFNFLFHVLGVEPWIKAIG